MDLSFLQTILTGLATAAIPAGITFGCVLLNKYTGVKISDANELAIRRAATTEAGKLVTTDTVGNPAAVSTSATKVLTDLPQEIAAEAYTHSDVVDMIMSAVTIAYPPLAALAPLVKIGESLGTPASSTSLGSPGISTSLGSVKGS
jgi:hypothetical protein